MHRLAYLACVVPSHREPGRADLRVGLDARQRVPRTVDRKREGASQFLAGDSWPTASPLTPALSPLREEGVAIHAGLPCVSAQPRTVRLRHRALAAAKRGQCFRHGFVVRRAPCPVTSHLGNSQVIGNQGRHPFVVQAGQKSSREVTGRNGRTNSGGFCPVTSHLGNSQVIGNQGRHPFVVQAGQKSSREVTGRNARTKSGGFSPLNGERAGVRGEAVRWAPGARLANTVHPPSPEGRTENSPAFQLKRWVTSPNIVRPEEGTAKFGLSAPVLNAQIG